MKEWWLLADLPGAGRWVHRRWRCWCRRPGRAAGRPRPYRRKGRRRGRHSRSWTWSCGRARAGGWGRRGLCPTPPSASAARRASSSPSCCVRPARTSWQILLGQTNDLLLQIILLLAAEHALCKIARLLQVCVDFVCSAVVSLLLYRNCFIALLFAMGIGFWFCTIYRKCFTLSIFDHNYTFAVCTAAAAASSFPACWLLLFYDFSIFFACVCACVRACAFALSANFLAFSSPLTHTMSQSGTLSLSHTRSPAKQCYLLLFNAHLCCCIQWKLHKRMGQKLRNTIGEINILQMLYLEPPAAGLHSVKQTHFHIN